MSLNEIYESDVLEQETDLLDATSTPSNEAANPRKLRKASDGLRRIEAYWEERRLKKQLEDELFRDCDE